MIYDKDLVSESSQQYNQTLTSNRNITESSLRMRAMAYLAQAKANLLMETIFEVENSRKSIQDELTYKDEMLFIQSRHAAMGEMISMIAHQWRQPISSISMGANSILADIELDMMSEDNLRENANEIIKQTQELSQTIDDFRGFFQPDKMKQKVFVKDVIQDTLQIINSSLVSSEIEVRVEHQKENEIETYARELMQVLINLLNNAKDALVQNRASGRKILISQKRLDDRVILEVCDNGGGIDEEILHTIFEPYFTTKSDKNGTGLGLHMSKTIVQRHLLGSIAAYNTKEGACFKVSLPLIGAEREDAR